MSGRFAPGLLAAACFLSFGWGMACHFRRSGAPAAWMRVTASLAIPFALINLAALFGRDTPYSVSASILYAAGLSLFWSSVKVSKGALAACGQSHISPRLLKRGPYRFIRHPFYLSYNLTWIAGFIATVWWPLAAFALVMAALYERFAIEEERALLSGDMAKEYAAYKRGTGKYLPKRVSD